MKYRNYLIEKVEGIRGDFYTIYDNNGTYVDTVKGLKEAKQYIKDL